MPFSENTRCIAGRLQDIGNGLYPQSEAFAFVNRMRHTILEGMPTRHQRATRWRTGWTHVKPVKPDAFVMQSIHIWCFQNRVSMTRQITVSLIIGKDKNNIGLLRDNGIRDSMV
jgi:hypothetical protein